MLKSGGAWSQAPPQRQAYANDIILAAEANALAEQMGLTTPVYG